MTWKELSELVEKMSPEQQGTDVTIYSLSQAEFYPVVNSIETAEEDDVLDVDHPYLVVAD